MVGLTRLPLPAVICTASAGVAVMLGSLKVADANRPLVRCRRCGGVNSAGVVGGGGAGDGSAGGGDEAVAVGEMVMAATAVATAVAGAVARAVVTMAENGYKSGGWRGSGGAEGAVAAATVAASGATCGSRLRFQGLCFLV